MMPTQTESAEALEALAGHIKKAATGLQRVTDDFASGENKFADELEEIVEIHRSGAITKKGKEKMATDPATVLRVKKASERYSDTKSVGRHVSTNQPVKDEHGKQVELPSEKQLALAGAYLKSLALRSGISGEMSEHDKELLAEVYDLPWAGKIGSTFEKNIPGSRAKALIGDATSGGAEISPEFFDEAIVQFPLLHSELLPLVDVRPVPRGSSVEGASVGNPTATWGTPEGTAMGVFDTAGLVSAIDTTIHPVSVAIEFGRDLMADSPVDIGRLLVENCGQRMLSELDKVIATGDGTTRPQGLFNASSITDIGNPAAGAGGDPAIDDYEALLFAVPKQYRTPAMRGAFIMSDTSYSRARGIPVGGSDARRVFGMDHEGYTLLGRKVVIADSIANNFAGFAAMAKYRLYRRAGVETRVVTEDQDLARKNLAMLIVRGRYGGRLMDSNAMAFSDNWKA